MSSLSGMFADNVRDTASSVTGTTVTLSNAAPTGYQTFGSVYSDSDYIPCYMIFDGTHWELTYGQYTSTGTTLSRASAPIASSNGGAQVASFSGTVGVTVIDSAAFFNMMQPGHGSVPNGGKSNAMIAAFGPGATSTLTAGVEYYMPVFLEAPFRTVQVGYGVPTPFAGTATVDVGFYANKGGQTQGKFPGRLLFSQTGMNVGTGASAGDMFASSMVANGSVPPLAPGLYWIGILPKTNSPTFTVLGNPSYSGLEIFGGSSVYTNGSQADNSCLTSTTGLSALEDPAVAAGGPAVNGLIVIAITSA